MTQQRYSQSTIKPVNATLGEILLALGIGSAAGYGVAHLALDSIGGVAAHWPYIHDFFTTIGDTDAERARSVLYISKADEHGVLWRIVTASILSPIVALGVAGAGYMMLGRGWKYAREEHIRGYQYIRDISTATRAAKKVAKRAVRKLGRGMKIHPAVELPFEIIRKGGMFLVGMPGASKTQLIWYILRQIHDTQPHAKNIILDASKGDFVSSYEWGAILIAPWDARSKKWAVAMDVRTKSEARKLADILIVESHDPMWSNAARAILGGLITYLCLKRPGRWGWRDLSDTLKLPADELSKILEQHAPESIRVIESLAGDGKTGQSVLINLDAYVSSIHSLAEAWGNPDPETGFSIREFLDDDYCGTRTVIIQNSSSNSTLAKSVNGALIAVGIAVICDQSFGDSDTRLISFILDEFPRLGKLLEFDDLISTGRSKGVWPVFGIQTIEQWRETYNDNIANSWVSMLSTRFIGGIGGGDTADAVCKLIGDRDIAREKDTMQQAQGGSSVTMQEKTEKVIIPAQLAMDLGKTDTGLAGILQVIGEGFDSVYRLEWPFTDLKELRRGSVPAKWTLAPTPFPALLDVDDAGDADDAGDTATADDADDTGGSNLYIPPALDADEIESEEAEDADAEEPTSAPTPPTLSLVENDQDHDQGQDEHEEADADADAVDEAIEKLGEEIAPAALESITTAAIDGGLVDTAGHIVETVEILTDDNQADDQSSDKVEIIEHHQAADQDDHADQDKPKKRKRRRKKSREAEAE